MIHQLQGMFGATDPWPQITVHRKYAARYAAALQTTIETFRTSLENLPPSQPNYMKVSAYLQNKLEDMYDRCCEVKEWSVVPFAMQEDGVLCEPVKDEDHTSSPHDIMAKRSTVKPMRKPLATAKESAELAFSFPRSIAQTGQRHLDDFPPEDPIRLTKSENHVASAYLPIKLDAHGLRAQPA
jgi:hypothetical protein